MALKSPRADAHPQGALLVRVSLADEAENFALALGQWFLPGGRRKHNPGDASAFPDRARSGLECSVASGRSGGSPLRPPPPPHQSATAAPFFELRFPHHLPLNSKL